MLLIVLDDLWQIISDIVAVAAQVDTRDASASGIADVAGFEDTGDATAAGSTTDTAGEGRT